MIMQPDQFKEIIKTFTGILDEHQAILDNLDGRLVDFRKRLEAIEKVIEVKEQS